MNEPKIKHIDNPLSMFLYQIDTAELLREQKTAYVCKWLNSQRSWTAKETDSVHDAFEAGWTACWKALCLIEETQQNAAVDADLAKLREEWTEI